MVAVKSTVNDMLQDLTAAAEDLTAFIRELVLENRSLRNRCNRAESGLMQQALHMGRKGYEPITLEWTSPEHTAADDDKCVEDAIKQFQAKRERDRG